MQVHYLRSDGFSLNAQIANGIKLTPSADLQVLLIASDARRARCVLEALQALGMTNVTWARDWQCCRHVMNRPGFKPDLILVDADGGSAKRAPDRESVHEIPDVLLRA